MGRLSDLDGLRDVLECVPADPRFHTGILQATPGPPLALEPWQTDCSFAALRLESLHTMQVSRDGYCAVEW